MNEQIGPAALLKRLGEQAPGMISSLPDMPDLLLDALTQLRSSGQWQEKQLREVAQLRADLRTGRRRDLLALAGMAGGMALALTSTGGLASAGMVLALATFAWRLATA